MTAHTLIVIPARWGSTRFPGKPLADLAGKTLVQRTVEVAATAMARRHGIEMVVATDDPRIADHVRGIGHPAVMTGSDLENGTERVLAAAHALRTRPDFVVNLQGDSPFTPPGVILKIVDALAAGACVATPVIELDWEALDDLRRHKTTSPFSGTTCARGADGRAWWFSKQIIPAIRNEDEQRRRAGLSPIYRHIGLYGYTMDALETFCATSPSSLERQEGLEQLRFIELGIPIQTVTMAAHRFAMNGIDTAADLEKAHRLLQLYGEPVWP